MKSNIKKYESHDLLDKVRMLSSYRKIPNDYWILGIQSIEDEFNVFDDEFHIFYGNDYIRKLVGTTNAGVSGLKNYNRYNSKGVAVIKTNEWYYNLWKHGYHRGKMPALKQCSPIKYYRDWNKDKVIQESGRLYNNIIGINFHTVLYEKKLSYWRKLIGGWSVGCQVVNHVGSYYKLLDLLKNQSKVSYCLIKEF